MKKTTLCFLLVLPSPFSIISRKYSISLNLTPKINTNGGWISYSVTTQKKEKEKKLANTSVKLIMEDINIILHNSISSFEVNLVSASMSIASGEPEKPASAYYRHLPHFG